MPTSDTDGAIHTWFSLTYSSHLVLDPVRTQHLPNAWHLEMAAMLDQLARAFPDVSQDGGETLALAAQEWECGELGDAEMTAIDMETNADDLHDECKHQDAGEDEVWECERENLRWYDWRSTEYDRWGRVQVPTETEQQARAAGRIVVSRTLLQSMPADWQDRFVRLLEQGDRVDAEAPESYDIRFYTASGARTTDPVPHYSRGRTYIEPRLDAVAAG